MGRKHEGFGSQWANMEGSLITKIIEVTNNNQNWGKFMVCRCDGREWSRKVMVPGGADEVTQNYPLLRVIGRGTDHIWVLDLQTGEGALFVPPGLASADLENHRIWVCPLFEPFLTWLYQQDLRDITALPDVLNLPDVPFEWSLGYRRPGPDKASR